MPSIESVVKSYIEAKPEVVFASLAELGRHGEWAANDLKIEATGEGPVTVGSEFTSFVHFMGKDINAAQKVTQLESPTVFAFSCEDSTGSYVHHYGLEPQGDGTQVEHRVTGQVTLANYFVLKTFGMPFIGKPAGRKFLGNLGASLK